MTEYDRRDLVCLHLDGHVEAAERTPAPPAVTAAGIGDALDLGDTAAGRVRLLEELATLEEEGLVDADERPVAGYDAPRTVYALTAAGRDHAAAVRERLRSATVEVTNGTSEEVPLGDIDRYFGDAEDPLLEALTRCTDEGRVPLEEYVGEEFVGRKEALAAVEAAIEESFTRGSKLVVVAGAAGMGKTSLVRTAIGRVAADRDDLVDVRGDCHRGATAPYEPLRQALAELPNGDDLLAPLAGARDAVTPDDPEGVDDRRTALFDDVADGLREVASGRPVVVFVDNLQWADEATLELLAHLATAIDEMVYPVAFVATSRDPTVAAGHDPTELRTRIGREGAYAEVTLDALAKPATRALLASVLGRQRLPEAFVELVHDRTGGNPLFVRETASHLLETGEVVPENDDYPTSPTAVTLPREVTEQIDRRLSALDEASRELLALGAVLGEHVPGRVLAEASDLPTARHREYVDVLVAGRLWEPADAEASTDAVPPAVGSVAADGNGDLRFVSGAVREAVVERLPEGLAREYHVRVAAAYRRVYGEALDEVAARVAHHHEQAGDAAAAVEHYRQAGDHARDTYANEEAIAHYERALALATESDAADETDLAALRADLAGVHRTRGAFDSAIATAEEGLTDAPERSRERCRLLDVVAQSRRHQGSYEQARETAREQRTLAADIGARDLEAAAIRSLGDAAWGLSEYERARERFERSLAIFRETGDRRGQARCRFDLGTVAQEQGEYDRAREQFERSLAVFREIDDRRGQADNLLTLGNLAFRQGGYEQARERYEESLDRFRDVGNRGGEANSLTNLGNVAQRFGEYDRARERYEQSLAIFRDVGDRRREAGNLHNLGDVAQRLGEYDRAREQLRASLDVFEDIGARSWAAHGRHNLADVARYRGEYDRAREQLQASLDVFREVGDSHGEATALLGLGAVARREGEHERAREHLRASLDVARDLGARELAADVLTVLGDLARDRGDHERAREHLDEALETAEAIDNRMAIAEARLAAGRLALSRGDVDEARERATGAREAFEAMGTTHWVGRSRRLLGRVAAESAARGDAREHWRASLETFETVGAPQDALATLRLLVETCRGEGDDDRARSLCGRAREVLAAAPEPVAARHRDWVERHAAELGTE